MAIHLVWFHRTKSSSFVLNRVGRRTFRGPYWAKRRVPKNYVFSFGKACNLLIMVSNEILPMAARQGSLMPFDIRYCMISGKLAGIVIHTHTLGWKLAKAFQVVLYWKGFLSMGTNLMAWINYPGSWTIEIELVSIKGAIQNSLVLPWMNMETQILLYMQSFTICHRKWKQSECRN